MHNLQRRVICMTVEVSGLVWDALRPIYVTGKSAIEWQPVKQALTRRLAVCPTCSGRRVQKCLNCTGAGVVAKAVGAIGPR